jgi:hypothetical protein
MIFHHSCGKNIPTNAGSPALIMAISWKWRYPWKSNISSIILEVEDDSMLYMTSINPQKSSWPKLNIYGKKSWLNLIILPEIHIFSW